jgi:hypothetical protein
MAVRVLLGHMVRYHTAGGGVHDEESRGSRDQARRKLLLLAWALVRGANYSRVR